MDNDNKIAEQTTHKGVQLFLADVLKPLEKGHASLYDLNSEYAKTKKNHNRSVWILLAVSFAVVALATVAVTAYVSHSNHKISITIDTFDDLNLKGLLSSVGRTQSLFETAQRQKASLEAARDAELKQAENDRENALFTLESVASVTSKATMNRRRSEIQKNYEENVLRIRQTYDEEIQAAEKEMAMHQSQLSSYDDEKLTQARENEAALDSQKQLHDLEVNRLTTRYEQMLSELREKMDAQQKETARAQREAVENVRRQYQTRIDLLDPLVKDKKGNEVVATTLAEGEGSFSASQYSYGLNQSTASPYLNTLKTVESQFDEFDYLYRIVRAIPQENNIPQYVDSMQKLTVDIGKNLADRAFTLQKDVENLSARLELNRRYYEQYVADHQAQALVLDGSYGSMIPLYMTKNALSFFEEADTLPAQILEGKRAVAEVTVQKQEDGFFAVLKDAKQAANVHTFQVVRLVLPGVKK